jgi:hypothetical protein
MWAASVSSSASSESTSAVRVHVRRDGQARPLRDGLAGHASSSAGRARMKAATLSRVNRSFEADGHDVVRQGEIDLVLYAEIACYTCTHYATTPKFLAEFEEMERDLRFQIELGRETGRAHWIEKNERKLALIRPIISALQAGTTVARLSKAQRETGSRHEVGKAAKAETPE